MYDCFRPGDIVRAEVLSLGDSRSYYLSTSKNHLGVVYAKSAAGAWHVCAKEMEMGSVCVCSASAWGAGRRDDERGRRDAMT